VVQFGESQPLAGRRILIIDDSKDITSLVADTFSMAGAQSTQVNNGADAMMFLITGGFDLVVLDMMMPQPDGWRILQFMHEQPEWLRRTIILTAKRYDGCVAHAAEQYGVTVLYKPFLLTELIETACRLLASGERTTAA